MRDADFEQQFAAGTVRAWRVSVPAPTPEKPHATIASWIINGPFNLHCTRWVMMVVHLRNEPGILPAKHTKSGTTHAFMIYAVHPIQGPLDPENFPESVNFCHPAEFEADFVAANDEDAKMVLESAVRMVASGQASPDRCNAKAWGKLLEEIAAFYARGCGDPACKVHGSQSTAPQEGTPGEPGQEPQSNVIPFIRPQKDDVN